MSLVCLKKETLEIITVVETKGSGLAHLRSISTAVTTTSTLHIALLEVVSDLVLLFLFKGMLQIRIGEKNAALIQTGVIILTYSQVSSSCL
jgi:hypothetical protein